MNIRAGSFRLWIVLSVLWVLGTGWFLRDDLLGNCSEPINPDEPNICELAHEFGGCVYQKLKPGRNDGEARRGSGVNE